MTDRQTGVGIGSLRPNETLHDSDMRLVWHFKHGVLMTGIYGSFDRDTIIVAGLN